MFQGRVALRVALPDARGRCPLLGEKRRWCGIATAAPRFVIAGCFHGHFFAVVGADGTPLHPAALQALAMAVMMMPSFKPDHPISTSGRMAFAGFVLVPSRGGSFLRLATAGGRQPAVEDATADAARRLEISAVLLEGPGE